MTANEAALLMTTTKKEIFLMRETYAKKNKRCPAFRPHIWDSISKLKPHYSRKVIMHELAIGSSQYAKAKELNSGNTSKGRQFIELSSIAPLDGEAKYENKIILEIKTKNGNLISVYE